MFPLALDADKKANAERQPEALEQVEEERFGHRRHTFAALAAPRHGARLSG
jgi:hypothetical protein